MKTTHLLLGCAYYPEYLPYDRMDTDMDMMVKAGMNTIRIAESTWSTLEPSDGVFNFSILDRTLEAAGRHHLSVIIGTPTYAIPAWLYHKYPDILADTATGVQRYGHRQNMDITHPGYLFHVKRMLHALLTHIHDNPNIIGYQLDNETKSYDTSGERVQSMFLAYLKENFPDIDEFNEEFGLSYWSNRMNCWEDYTDIRGTINQSLEGEFRRFQRSLVTDFLSMQAAIVREYAKEDQFLTQNFDSDWTSVSYGYQSQVNQFEACRALDVAGTDIYHLSQGKLTGFEITLCGNISRGLKKENYLVLETQAQGNPEWLPYPGQLRLQAYSHIANGSNSVMYWHWHSIHNAIESYWKGVLSHDLSENACYQELSTFGQEWNMIDSHLKNLQKDNKVAVIIDNASLTGLSLFPLPERKEHSYNHVLRQIGKALYRLNVEFDILSSAERDFSSYECVIVPVLYSADDSLLHALNDYVAVGGHLIATFKTGFCDKHLKIHHDIQPHILHKCLGIHYDQFTIPDSVAFSFSEELQAFMKHTIPLSSGHAKNDMTHSVSDFMELVTCDSAIPLAIYAHSAWNIYSAVTENQFGGGSALYLATLPDETALEQIFTYYLSKIHLLETTLRFPIIVKQGINDNNQKLYYYFNYSDNEVTLKHIGQPGTELLTNEKIMENQSITLIPWGLAIVEI